MTDPGGFVALSSDDDPENSNISGVIWGLGRTPEEAVANAADNWRVKPEQFSAYPCTERVFQYVEAYGHDGMPYIAIENRQVDWDE